MFLCLMREHSLSVSTSPEIQDDLPVPGGPATIIPRNKTNETALTACVRMGHDFHSLSKEMNTISILIQFYANHVTNWRQCTV